MEHITDTDSKTGIIIETFYKIEGIEVNKNARERRVHTIYAVGKREALAHAVGLEESDYEEVTVYEGTNAKVEVSESTKNWIDVDWHNAIESYLKSGGTPSYTTIYHSFQKRQLKIENDMEPFIDKAGDNPAVKNEAQVTHDKGFEMFNLEVASRRWLWKELETLELKIVALINQQTKSLDKVPTKELPEDRKWVIWYALRRDKRVLKTPCFIPVYEWHTLKNFHSGRYFPSDTCYREYKEACSRHKKVRKALKRCNRRIALSRF